MNKWIGCSAGFILNKQPVNNNINECKQDELNGLANLSKAKKKTKRTRKTNEWMNEWINQAKTRTDMKTNQKMNEWKEREDKKIWVRQTRRTSKKNFIRNKALLIMTAVTKRRSRHKLRFIHQCRREREREGKSSCAHFLGVSSIICVIMICLPHSYLSSTSPPRSPSPPTTKHKTKYRTMTFRRFQNKPWGGAVAV